MFKKSFQTMGVINLTPNSFYQSSQHFNHDEVFQKIFSWKDCCDIFDLGAESTAPHNIPITSEEEMSRFEQLAFPALIKFHRQFHYLPKLSIDTYRAETFSKVALKLREIEPNIPLVWNDVSGLFDQDVLAVLHSHQANSYILCHNRVPARERTGFHREYSLDQPSKLTSEILAFFQSAAEKCKKLNISERVSFDLNFGFAKSREDNLHLLTAMSDIMNRFSDNEWFLGLSHKSFLKIIDVENDFHYRELLHFYLLTNLKKTFCAKNLVVRVHDPHIVQLVNSFSEIQNI